MSIEIGEGPARRGPSRHIRDEAWIQARVTVTEAGCWEWTGSRLPGGYGQFTEHTAEGRRTRYAHRLSYEVHVGPIEDGLQVRHTCDNPPCVAPHHLVAGTRSQNMQDAVRRGRMNVEQRSKLTALQVRQIRAWLSYGFVQREIAAWFGVSRPTISQISRGFTWRTA